MGLKKHTRFSQFLLAAIVVAGFATAASTLPSSASAAPMRIATDIGGMVRVNSTARLLAGLPPTYPAHFGLAANPVWKEHSEAMRAAWSKIIASRVSAMTAWRDSAIESTCPGGKTLLYPFSGPDFFNAYWMFPACENYVLFGLEHIGDVPDLDAARTRDLGRLLGDVRISVSDLLDRNYFITENMSRQLRTAQLRGVVPLLIIPMALSGVEILRIVPHALSYSAREPAASLASGAAKSAGISDPATVAVVSRPKVRQRPMRQMRGITIEFRTPGSATVQRLHYFTLDATDTGLAHYPEFIAYLNGLAPTNTFMKAASYLLHGRQFRKLSQTLLEVSDFLVQDDTGLPYNLLRARQWDMRLYGVYNTPIPPFERAFQPLLDQDYRASRPDPLPFDFGYNFSDKRENRANVMVGRKITAHDGPRGAVGTGGSALKTASQLLR